MHISIPLLYAVITKEKTAREPSIEVTFSIKINETTRDALETCGSFCRYNHYLNLLVTLR